MKTHLRATVERHLKPWHLSPDTGTTNHTCRYTVYLPRKDGSLCWRGCLAAYRNGLHVNSSSLFSSNFIDLYPIQPLATTLKLFHSFIRLRPIPVIRIIIITIVITIITNVMATERNAV